MTERVIDISMNKPRLLTVKMAEEADKVMQWIAVSKKITSVCAIHKNNSGENARLSAIGIASQFCLG